MAMNGASFTAFTTSSSVWVAANEPSLTIRDSTADP